MQNRSGPKFLPWKHAKSILAITITFFFINISSKNVLCYRCHLQPEEKKILVKLKFGINQYLACVLVILGLIVYPPFVLPCDKNGMPLGHILST